MSKQYDLDRRTLLEVMEEVTEDTVERIQQIFERTPLKLVGGTDKRPSNER